MQCCVSTVFRTAVIAVDIEDRIAFAIRIWEMIIYSHSKPPFFAEHTYGIGGLSAFITQMISYLNNQIVQLQTLLVFLRDSIVAYICSEDISADCSG